MPFSSTRKAVTASQRRRNQARAERERAASSLARRRLNFEQLLEEARREDEPSWPAGYFPAGHERPQDLYEMASSSGRHYSKRPLIAASQMSSLKKSWDNTSKRPRTRSAQYAFPRNVGRGDYMQTLKSIGRAIQKVGQRTIPKGSFAAGGARLGQAIGGTLSGSALGAAGGGLVGSAAGQAFSKLVGFGDYSIKANSLMDLPMGQPVAAFGNMSNATIVTHREFVQDIIVPAAPNEANFNVVKIPLNAGLRSVFPWLSNLAGNYQEYQFIGCVFEFRSLSSDSAATLPMGSIVIASNYDTADPNYSDKRHMENSQFCVSGKPSANLIHPIECDPSVTFVPIKYTRTGGLASGTDSRLYDHCNVQVATQGLPAGTGGSVIGELWVTYEVALYKPQLGVAAALRDHYYGTTATAGAITTGSVFGAAVASAAAVGPRGGAFAGLGTQLTNSSGITFPADTAPGKFEIVQWFYGPVAFFNAPAVPPTFSNAQMEISDYYINGTQAAQATDGANETVFSVKYVVIAGQPLSSPCTVSFAHTFNAPGTAFELEIAAMPAAQI